MTLNVTRDEVLAIEQLIEKPRFRDWYATFSTNASREIWLFVRWGHTPREERLHVSGRLQLLRRISDEFLLRRPEGGRFFVNRWGAFLHENAYGPYEDFILFHVVQPKPPVGPVIVPRRKGPSDLC